MLALGLSTLRWRPRDLWAATPREIAAAAGLRAGPGAALDRAAFDQLLLAYPDPEIPR